ncbi:MAG: 3-oxoacyl-ACP reductase FabG [Treponema sp.]|jgi:3-oxoacyl-[acyl-carrier protein] reductase|nr:3-oxoacyl-ACP reductase FabG [Treponema sp.]
MDNHNRNVLITGASRGIGRATALAAAKAGYSVSAHYHNSEDAAQSLLTELRAEHKNHPGADARLIRFDIKNRKETRAALDAWLKENGVPWGVICNAGICADNTFAALDGAEWDSVIQTNLDSFYNVLQPLILPLARKKQGRIITLSSVSGIMGNRGQVNYSASKAGIIGATKALAVELASRSITVNCIAPGIIETEMIKDSPLDLMLQAVPMGRVGRPEEVAALAVFLLSEEAAYITRQVISVNGGII